MSLVSVYGGNDRPTQQVINAFYQEFKTSKLKDIILDGDEDLREAFDSAMARLVEIIEDDEPRLGEPGFKPDIKWYIKQAIEDKDEEVISFFDIILEPSRKAFKALVDSVDTREYAIDWYGDYVGTEINDISQNAEDLFKYSEGKSRFGFKNAKDFAKAARECTPTVDAYDGGDYGVYDFHADEDCNTPEDDFHLGSIFLGEEELCADYIFEGCPLDTDALEDIGIDIGDDYAFVKGDCAYVTSNFIVYSYVKIAKIIEKGKELGLVDENYQFSEDENTNN